MLFLPMCNKTQIYQLKLRPAGAMPNLREIGIYDKDRVGFFPLAWVIQNLSLHKIPQYENTDYIGLEN